MGISLPWLHSDWLSVRLLSLIGMFYWGSKGWAVATLGILYCLFLIGGDTH